MKLSLERSSATPLYLQIAHILGDQINSGFLPEGHRLPPERELARSLGLNRSTVFAAYNELKADGLVEAHVGRGTVVLPQRFGVRSRGALQPFSWRNYTRRSATVEPEPLIRDLLELASRPDVIPLSIGLPAPELLPLEALQEIQQRLLRDRGSDILLHSPTEGVASLRSSLAEHLAGRGIQCDPSEILITTGSLQGFDLLRRVLLEPGDVVVVEQPSFFGALAILRDAEARVVPVPVDDAGMRVDLLEETLGRLRPKLIYTLPTYQNPSGATLSLERRKQLLELAWRFQVPIVEDDMYWDLRYAGEAIPPLRALDRLGHVVYLSSISKVLFPGFRLGWIVAPRPLARILALVKQTIDLHSTTFGQWVLDAFLREGHWQGHVETLRREYGKKCKCMLDALQRFKASGLSYRPPEGGFYVWCQYPRKIPAARLMVAAGRHRVAYLPGEACLCGDAESNYLRLNFTFPSSKQIRLGVQRLAAALTEVAQEPQQRPPLGSETRPIT